MNEVSVLYVGPGVPAELTAPLRDMRLPLLTAATAAEARQLMLERPCGMVLLDLPLPDEFGTALASDLAENPLTQVLLLSPAGQYELLSGTAVPAGIPVLAKPLDAELTRQALWLLLAGARKLAALERRAAAAEQKMADLRFVSRAKILLMEREHMSEQAAHRYIEKTAMDLGMKSRQVAIRIIHRYD